SDALHRPPTDARAADPCFADTWRAPTAFEWSHLHKFERSGRDPRLNDPVRDAGGVQLTADLLYDFAPMRQHQHRFHSACRGADNLSADDGLTRARRCYQYDAMVTFLDPAIKFIDNIALILAKSGIVHDNLP